MISQETIEAVRSRVSIVSVIGERVRLERRGQNHLGLCPFHKEKTPSFNVNAERGFFHCFGCQASGNVISFIQQLDGLTFPEAVRELAERAGIEVQETGSNADRQQEAEARRRKDELYRAGALAAEYFERCLSEHPLASHARGELRRRKLAPEFAENAAQALTAFRVGYAPYGWDGLARHLRQVGFNLRAAEAVGLLGERKSGDGHFDRFRHRLMFAVMDLQGRIVAFSGRSLDEPSAEELARAGQPPPRKDAARPEPPAKYYNSPESPIYRKRETVFGLYQARQTIRERDRAVVVEGNFDVVSLHARGITNVVAPLGTAFTGEQAAQIKRYSNSVTLLFDGDSAGQRATRAAREPCHAQGLQARVAQLPAGKDPDDVVREGGRESIDRVLAGARGLLEYLIDSVLRSGFSTDDAVARAAKVREVEELIKSEEDPAAKAMAERLADEIAGRLGVFAGEDIKSFRAIASAVRGAARGPVTAPQAPARQALPPEQARSPSRVDQIRQQLFGAALEYPSLLGDPEVIALLDVIDGDIALGLGVIGSLAAQGLDLSTAAADPPSFLGAFPESLRPLVAMRLAVPQIAKLEAARGVLIDNLSKLRRLAQRREQSAVKEELRKAQVVDDFAAQEELLRQQLARARMRHKLE
ncbi:MAG TPA: CHC2 zinc finger domain-containing protein [Polyangiaceae bacterium]|nr:CHC2 zinc finger domain-containing protein [Polyangiaceae bacterium]